MKCPSRKVMIRDLAVSQAEAECDDNPYSFILDVLTNGFVGYSSMSDEDIQVEWLEYFGDDDDE